MLTKVKMIDFRQIENDLNIFKRKVFLSSNKYSFEMNENYSFEFPNLTKKFDEKKILSKAIFSNKLLFILLISFSIILFIFLIYIFRNTLKTLFIKLKNYLL